MFIVDYYVCLRWVSLFVADLGVVLVCVCYLCLVITVSICFICLDVCFVYFYVLIAFVLVFIVLVCWFIGLLLLCFSELCLFVYL